MNFLLKYSFVLMTMFATSSCQEKTRPEQYLRSMFNNCKRIIEAPAEKLDGFCHCVAKKVVATHTVGELKALSNSPTDLVEKDKPRTSVHACSESSGNENNASSPTSRSNSALTKNECDELVRREFSSTSVHGPPVALTVFKSCQLGRGHYNRNYFDCVFESMYSDPVDCAYNARGIDRSKKEAALKDRKVGDYGHYSGTATIAIMTGYRSETPRTAIDKFTLDMYLARRNNAFRSVGKRPPNDDRAPLNKVSSSISSNEKTYWVVKVSFTDLQLVKIMLESEKGINEVFCARYGSMEQIRIDSGYCAALIKKHFNETLVD